jgi:CBS domain-containing protein
MKHGKQGLATTSFNSGVPEMKVKKAMHKGVIWAAPDASLSELARKMRENDIGAIPVGENDRLIGMVTDRDIVCRGLAGGRDVSTLTARDVMTPGIVYCEDDDDIEDALELMEKKQIRRLPVINDEKRMVGILSLGDISHAVPEELSAQILKAVSAHHSR